MSRRFSFPLLSGTSSVVASCLLLAIAVGCSNPTDVPRTYTNPEHPDAPFAYASPQEVGLSDVEVHEVADLVYRWVRDGDIVGGEVLLVKDQRIVLHETVGWSDREREIPLARNSIYRMRSMTKPFIGTAILALAEDGRLNIDDTAASILDSYANQASGSITIRQLLTHTAGFEQVAFPDGYWDHSTLREAVDLVGNVGPPNSPGTGFRYSDWNSATLGAIVAELTGAPVEDYLQARICDVIGLSDTHAWFGPDLSWASRMNSTYSEQDDEWVKYWDNTMEQVRPFFRASGGLYSTVFDYAQFLTVWMNGGSFDNVQLLDDSTVHQALSGDEVEHYGYHWQIYSGPTTPGMLPVFGHGGSDGTVAVAFPEQNALALYFTQSRGNPTTQSFVVMVSNLFGQ